MIAAMIVAWTFSMMLPVAGLPAAGVQAVTIEGDSIDGIFAGIDAAGAIVLEQGNATRKLQPADLASLRWFDPSLAGPPASSRARVYLADGSRLFARIIRGNARQLVLQTGPVAELPVELAAVTAIRFARQTHQAAQAAFDQARSKRDPARDLLVMLRDDRVRVLHGVVESLDADGGTFKWRNRSVPIHFDRTYGLVFATGVHRAAVAPAHCHLGDGTIWAGRLVGGSANDVTFELTGGQKLTLLVADVSAIRFHSDRVTFLDALEPTAYAFEPFGTTHWPWRRNRSAANRPLRIGGRTFERGIGVHARATLVYDLDRPYRRLAAIIGIDEAVGLLGNVIFRVFADGKEVFKSEPVTGSDEPLPILVPIDGARQIELVVEFGEQLDLGDQANWAHARLIQ